MRLSRAMLIPMVVLVMSGCGSLAPPTIEYISILHPDLTAIPDSARANPGWSLGREAAGEPPSAEEGGSVEDSLGLTIMDMGRYRARIRINPLRPGKYQGFFHMDIARQGRLVLISTGAVQNLAEEVQREVGIKMDTGRMIDLDSAELLKMPLVYLSGGGKLTFSDAETKNVGEYLRRGGLLFVDGLPEPADPFLLSLQEMLKKALGDDYQMTRLKSDHPLYHSFHDFDAPPRGSRGSLSQSETGFLEGVHLDGHLAVVVSRQGYARAWARRADKRQLQFGVNLIMFALTQPTGIVARQGQ